VILGSKQAVALAMAVHELGTNAIKYGALSIASGRIDITWQQTQVDRLPTFQFRWQEKHGPPVSKPSRKGFGSRLIGRLIEGDFGGEVDLNYQPSGVICRVSAPMHNLERE
jgi:two-component sensor histidine kinase